MIKYLQGKWDWWIYCRAVNSLRRISERSPGFSYLMELHLRKWNGIQNIPESLKQSTETFFDEYQ